MNGFAPHRAFMFVLGLAFGAGLLAQNARAAVDSFLRLEGVPGESRQTGHSGSIEVLSWSWGTSRATSIGSATGGAGAGKVSVQEIHITKTVDSASPLLMRACATGQHFPSAVLEHPTSGGRIEKIVLQDVLISSVQNGRGGEVPTESITLNFAKISYSYSNATEHTNAMPLPTMAPTPLHY